MGLLAHVNPPFDTSRDDRDLPMFDRRKAAMVSTAEHHDRVDPPARFRAKANASRRTLALSILLVAGSCVVLTRLSLDSVDHDGFLLSWWSLALIAFGAELMVFNVEFRKQIYSFTFSEIPLVLGLLLASPLHLVIGRLVGEAVFLIVKERQAREKVMLNMASFLAECAVLLSVYGLIGSGSTIEHPRAWVEALVAISAADLVGFVVVAKAVRWHGGPLQLRSILQIGALTAPVNTTFALVAGILLTEDPWALLLLTGIAGFLVVAYRSYSALTQRFESLSLLYDFTRLVSGAQRPEVVLEAILVQAKDLLRAERAEIWLMDLHGCLGLMVDDEGRHTRDLPPDTASLIDDWFRQQPGTSISSQTARDARLAVLATALSADECIVSPVTEAGETVGLLAVINRLGGGGFRPQEAPMFATLANHASVALENGRLIDRLNEQAHQREHESLHDALTGLPNRVLFARRLDEQVARLGIDVESVAIAVMDLDGFKEINDTLGHHSGDSVLVEAATRIRNIVDPSVLVARLGGDEFALLFPDSTPIHALETCGRAIRKDLMRPMIVDKVRINVGISIGLSVAPEHGVEAPVLLQRADVAMYGAKTGLGDGVNFYRADADTNTTRRLALANDLNGAIDNQELTLVFQPKVRLCDGSVTGFEALVRWTHPQFGRIGPDEFIPLAERTGAIHQITDYVLRTALAQLQVWGDAGRPWGMSVNLSMRNLLDSSLVRRVEELLEGVRVDPRRLTLEITETNVMSDPNRTIAVLEELANTGIRLSVDDFGTGYSSLSYLQRLPVQEVKIDKTFVLPLAADEGAEAIVRSILALARSMKLKVVAEGIENRATWDRLRELGCDEGQGYFMGRGASASELGECLLRLESLGLAGTTPAVEPPSAERPSLTQPAIEQPV
jgi:diguanylate cyclase (GGDEF)-like protein